MQALSTITSPLQAFSTAAAAFVGLLIADLVSGVFHWSVDNYGDRNTPVFGTVIEAFQGHHGERSDTVCLGLKKASGPIFSTHNQESVTHNPESELRFPK